MKTTSKPYKVLWQCSDGFYAAALEAEGGSPEALAKAWRDTDYFGPYPSELEALRMLNLDLANELLLDGLRESRDAFLEAAEKAREAAKKAR